MPSEEKYTQGTLFDRGKLSMRQFEPIANIQQGVASYAEGHGRSYDPDMGANSEVLGVKRETRWREVKDAYKGTHSPELDKSYEALRSDIHSQYTHLTTPREQGGAGVNVEFTKGDPYPSPKAMRDDVAATGRLKIFESGDDFQHSHLSREENNQLRAVHDAYGHLASGRNFSRHGEEGAFQHHRQVFSPESHLALTSELRGQTSYLIGSGGDFAPNTGANLPHWMTTHEGAPPEPSQKPKPKPEGTQLRFEGM